MSDILERLKKRLGEDYVASRQAESAQSTPFSVEGRKAELAKTIPEVKSVLDYAEAAGRDKRWGYNRQNAYDLAVRKAREYEMNFDPQRAIKEALPRLPSPNSDALMGWGADYRSTQARSSDNAAQRMERYEKNQTRIEEINKRLKELEGGGINKAFEITPEGVRENGTSSSGSFEITPEGVKPKTQTENYSDAQKEAIELRAEKSKLESENGQYKGSSGQYTSDLFRRGVANQKKDDKSLGYDVDAMSWFQDGDYEKYYNNSEFIRWWMARDESKRGTNEEYRDWQDEAALLDSTGGRFSHLEYLTNEELQDVFYILHKQGPEEVDQFLTDMKPTLDARADMEDRETIENAHPMARVLGNVLSVPANVLLSPVSLVGNIEDLINTGKVNPNNSYNIARNFTENVRGTSANKLNEATGNKEFLGVSLGDVYQSGMSTADSALGMLTTGGAYTVLMGMSAAASSMEEAAVKDLPTWQAVGTGLVAGLVEYFTEKVSLETFLNNFMSGNAHKLFSLDTLKNIGLQGLAEASEEMASEILNAAADVAINGDRSEILDSMYAHIREGYNPNQALGMAFGEKALDVWKAGAGGLLSGGMMGVGGATINSSGVPSYSQIGNQIIDNDSANILRGLAADLASEESGIALGDKAAKKITRAAENYDKRGTARSLGKLATTVQGEVAQANSSEITNAVKKAGLKGEDANRAETIFNILAETPNFELSDEDAAFIQRDDVFGAYDKLFGQRGSADAVSRYTNEGWNTLKGAVQYGQINESQAARIARNARTEYAFADKGVRTEPSLPGVGKKGNEVVAEAKERGVDIEPVVAAYNQGVKGEELTVRDTKASPEVGENIQKQAYNAGVLDAAAEKANVEKYGKAVVNESPGLDMESVKKANVKYTSGEIRRADALGKVTGSKVEIVRDLTDENGKSVNALYDANTATIKISAKATSPFTAALSHETVHRIRDVSEDAYKSLKRFVIANMSKEKLTAAMGVRGVAYGTFDEDFVSEETVADAFGDILDADPSAIDELVKDDRNLGEKIRDVIRDLIIKIDRYLNRKRDLKKMTAEERKAWEEERTEFAELRKKLVQAESRFSSALNETVYSLDMQEKIEDAGTGVDEKTAEIPKVTKFSMKSPVEQTKDLVAVHNLSVSELEKSLDLGGLPMPSIAIIRAGQGHSEYGDVSIVFPKDAIDPQKNKDNKIYSGDAWTPTFPTIEYKINEKVASKIRKKYYDLYYKYGSEAVDALYPWGNYAENQLNRVGGEKAIFDRYADDTDMMNLFLLDTTGENVEPVTVTETSEMDDDLKEESKTLLEQLGENFINEFEEVSAGTTFGKLQKWMADNADRYDEALQNMYRSVYELSEEEAKNIVDNMAKKDRYIKMANMLKYSRNGGVQTTTQTDTEATKKAVREATDEKEYNQWLKELFSGIEEKKGIYNNRERYTPSGNLRSFEALHYEITLDNIIREMKSHENAETMFGGNAVWGAAVRLFKSIDEVKADAGRIYKADYEEYKKIKEKYIERLSSISSEVLGDSLENKDTFDRFTLLDDAAGAIAEAIKGKRTVDSVMRLLREYKYLKNVNEDVARKIIDLADDIASMPTEYFEAKPERAVMFEEAAAVIVPDTTSEETKQRVRDLGSTITEYKAGDEKSRLEALNSVEGVRFSRAISPEDSARYLELAKDPEKNEAELSQMVEVAARKSGFATKAYHLGEKGITAFQSGNFAGLIYFADSVKVAKKAARSTKQVYPVYLKITNPVNTKRTPMNWYDAEDNIKAAEWRRNGNDAIYVKDEAGTSTAVFSPSQIKSADPVTYDSDGNVIPLEERFNPENEDIRYSRDLTQSYEEYNKKYGSIPPGERPFRDVAVPERTAKDKKVAQTVRTVLEAEATPETMVPTIKEMIADGDFSYDVYTDEAALANAAEDVKKAGFADALTRWTRAVARGKVNKTITAEGWALYNAAATAGDTEAALTILRNMVANTRSAAQALQAVRILKKLSPEAQLYNVVKTVDQLIKDAKDRYGRHLDITVDPDLAEDFLNERSQEERDRILQKIYKVIAQQLPARFIDRWNSWRYLSMLGNPRTHIRNIAGNALFAPIVMTKNAFATGIEAVVSRASRGKLDRTKANIVGRQGAALLSAARADYTAIQDEALGERKYSDASQQMVSDIEKYRPRFGGSKWKVWNKTGGAALDWLNRKNSEALDKEDVWFSRPHYAVAMAQYCKAHGITAEQIRSGKGLDAARAYAIKEAQKATYRDTNVFSQAVSRLGRKNTFDNKFERVGKTLVEGILPFRKTPANILVRGVEYSPLGLLKAMTTDIAAVRMNTALAMAEADDVNVRIENNEKSMRRAYVTTGMSLEDIAAKTGASLESVEKMAKAGKWGAARADYRAKLAKAAKVLTPMTGAEMIDHLSAGLTGTGLVALGALLASFGLVRGHGKDDDKEEKFDQLTGHQNYALELPNGVSITLDWLAPESLPFFVGVNLFQEWQDKDQGSLEDLLTAIGNTTEPFIEMSCLQSLNDLLDSIGYAKSKGMASLPSILVSMATSYISQGIPTIGGQTERTIEDKRMTTFTDKKGAARDLQYQLGKASAKIPIPGVEYNQIPYIDAWGREESTGILPYRAFSNFVNPAYVKQISADEVEQELLWVYEGADKDGGVFPSRAEQSFTVNGQEFNLNAQEFVKYATVRGQTSYETVGMLTKNDAYRDLPDADKAAAIKDAYSYATVTARTTVGAPYPTSSTYSWVPKAAEANRRGITPDVYILVKNAVSNNGGIPGADGKTIDNSKGLLTMEYIYGIPGLTNAQKRYLFDVFNVGKKVIGYSQSQVESALKEMRGK